MKGITRAWIAVIIEVILSKRGQELTVQELATETLWHERTCRKRMGWMAEKHLLCVGSSFVRGTPGARPVTYRIGPAWVNLCLSTLESIERERGNAFQVRHLGKPKMVEADGEADVT